MFAAVIIHEIPQVSDVSLQHYGQCTQLHLFALLFCQRCLYERMNIFEMQELSDVSIISKAGGTWVQCLVLNVLGTSQTRHQLYYLKSHDHSRSSFNLSHARQLPARVLLVSSSEHLLPLHQRPQLKSWEPSMLAVSYISVRKFHMFQSALINFNSFSGFRLAIRHVIPKLSTLVEIPLHFLVFNGEFTQQQAQPMLLCPLVLAFLLTPSWQLVGFQCSS